MWVDGRANATAREIRSDVCLIGAGAAGIAIGLRLADSQFALMTEIRFYPPVMNEDRDRLIGARFQARNGTGPHLFAWFTLEIL